MKYEVFGGFEIPRNDDRLGNYNKSFWDQVETTEERLSEACGCYIFALQNGDNLKPWYIGKSERQPFKRECFSVGKRHIFDKTLNKRSGTPLLFLLPRMNARGKCCTPNRSKRKWSDIEFLERMLIGIALEQNRELANIQNTKLLRKLIVPGIVNSPRAAPTLPVRELRNALGLKKG